LLAFGAFDDMQLQQRHSCRSLPARSRTRSAAATKLALIGAQVSDIIADSLIDGQFRERRFCRLPAPTSIFGIAGASLCAGVD
jgi:hypothetical protein